MYRNMEQWSQIRQQVLVDGISKRQVLRETGLHWQTLEKILANSAPPVFRGLQARPKPSVGPYLSRISSGNDDTRA